MRVAAAAGRTAAAAPRPAAPARCGPGPSKAPLLLPQQSAPTPACSMPSPPASKQSARPERRCAVSTQASLMGQAACGTRQSSRRPLARLRVRPHAPARGPTCACAGPHMRPTLPWPAGTVEEVLPRRSELPDPRVANVDQVRVPLHVTHKGCPGPWTSTPPRKGCQRPATATCADCQTACSSARWMARIKGCYHLYCDGLASWWWERCPRPCGHHGLDSGHGHQHTGQLHHCPEQILQAGLDVLRAVVKLKGALKSVILVKAVEASGPERSATRLGSRSRGGSGTWSAPPSRGRA